MFCEISSLVDQNSKSLREYVVLCFFFVYRLRFRGNGGSSSIMQAFSSMLVHLPLVPA
jgi:hypothetical protein